MVTEWLTSAGFKVRQAANGATALEMLRACAPRLLITDVQMPKLDGADLVAAAQREGAHIPVIAMSGNGQDKLSPAQKRALATGAQKFLRKPFTRAELLDTISALTAHGRPA